MVKNYKVYGLNIRSEIEIEELVELDNLSDKNVDVTYSYGIVPDRFKELINDKKITYYSKNEIWFYIKGVASYYITNGDSVLVQPCKNADKQLINIFLTGSCLGFIMIQKRNIAIHGSAMLINNKCMILTGNRGAGKSTLSTALRLKGYKLLSDDVSAITIKDAVYVEAGFPYQKLCEDAMVKLGYNKDKYKSPKSNTERKYLVPILEQFIYESKKLQFIIEIECNDSDEINIVEIKGSEKLNRIIQNIYRNECFTYIGGLSSRQFKLCLEVARNIKFYKLTRPRNKFTVDKQIENLEKIFIDSREESCK